MEQTNCLKDFIRYTSLNVLGMIGLSFYILADTFFVSNGVGANGLTALNLAVPVYSFIHGSGLMFGIGGASKYFCFKRSKGIPRFKQSIHKHCIRGRSPVSDFCAAGSVCF